MYIYIYIYIYIYLICTNSWVENSTQLKYAWKQKPHHEQSASNRYMFGSSTAPSIVATCNTVDFRNLVDPAAPQA